MELPDVVSPGVDFNLILSLKWIIKAGFGLDTKRRVLIYQGYKYPFNRMLVQEHQKEVVTTVIYSQEHCCVPSIGTALLKLKPFEQ